MKLFELATRVLALMLSLALMAPANIVLSAEDAVTTKIKHKPDSSYYPGFRIRIKGEIEDESGISIARCYFKTQDETDYLFVDMQVISDATYQGILPAPWLGSKAINYFFLVVNKDNRVIKSEPFEIKEEKTEESSEWNEARDTEQSEDRLDSVKKRLKKELKEKYEEDVKESEEKAAKGDAYVSQIVDDKSGVLVKSDAVEAPTGFAGFNDEILLGTVDAAERYSTAPAATVTASAAGSSTGILLGGIAAVAAGVAVGASGGGGGGGSSSSTASSSSGTGGLSDVTVSQNSITLTIYDNGIVDGDQIDLVVNGATLLPNHVLSGPPGTSVPVSLNSGNNSILIHADNQGSSGLNTAALEISNVTSGNSLQSWALATGEDATMTITAP